MNDPDERKLVISCGAALMKIRLAAAHARVGLHVELLPDGGDAELRSHCAA